MPDEKLKSQSSKSQSPTSLSLKSMTREGGLRLGHFIVEFATPGIGHLMKNAGCDFVLFDMEHSGFSLETVKSAVRYMEAARLPMIVRAPSKDYHHIARVLDMGAEGVMVPMVNDAEEARAIVDAVKYVPVGGRGVALGIAHDAYRSGAVDAGLARANDRTTIFAQIETAAGAANAEAIAAVDGIDCLWVGHFDLSASLGVPGDFGHRKFKDAIASTIEAARKHGKATGRLVPSVEAGVELHGEGFDLICYSGDVWMFGQALAEAVAAIRKGAKSIRGVKSAQGAPPQKAKKRKKAKA